MQSVKLHHLLLFLFFFLNLGNSFAQKTPYLERLVTINVASQPLSAIFNSIAAQTGVVFSYTRLDDRQKKSYTCTKKPLRLVLSELMKDYSCRYKAKDKYIILLCDEKSKANPVPPAVITGYLFDVEDSSRIESGSIYAKHEKRVALSDRFGFFSLSYPSTQMNISLSFAKESYRDTTLIIAGKSRQELVVYLHPLQTKSAAKQDQPVEQIVDEPVATIDTSSQSLPVSKRSFWSRFRRSNANFRNITDTLFSNFSVGIVPYISTNRLLSINTVNKYSLNVFVGYSKGVDILEIGGWLNIDNGNVKYFQAAGLGNIVSGTVKGVQLAGLFNQNSRHTTGVQAGGILNQANSLTGFQAGGILNYVNHKMKGMQVAGILNVADTVKGMQVAGLFNYARVVNGVQLAGLVNYAKQLDGVQLSVFNIADSCSGIPIGFFSFVNKGYHKLELSGDELFFMTLALRTGVKKFHNIFFSGMDLTLDDHFWSYGYGFGTSWRISRRWNFVSEITAQQIQRISTGDVSLNMINKAFAGIEWQAAPKFSMALGPTYNILVADIAGPDYHAAFDELTPQGFYQHFTGTTGLKMWYGGKISLKFL